MPDGALYSEPDAQSQRLPAMNLVGGYPIRGGNFANRVLACNGEWVQIESEDGVVGWWKGLCGEPIADCDRE